MSEDPRELKDKPKLLLVEGLSLEDTKPEDIADDEILFGEGLGLDSLDAVEIVVMLQRNFQIKVEDLQKGSEIFRSLDSLANYVHDKMKK